MPKHGRLAATAAATLTGVPIAAAAYLRTKYGPTVFDDLASILRLWRIGRILEDMKRTNTKLVDVFERHAHESPERAFVLHGDEVLSYGQADQEANRLARFVQSNGAVTCGDAAAILMLNEPSFILSWLAFAKLGLRIALLNYNLRGETLLHCIKACKVKVIACGKDTRLVDTLGAIMQDLRALNVRVLIVGEPTLDAAPVLDGMVRVNTWNERGDPIPRSVRDGLHMNDDAVYIFTSGTTGLPKPVIFTYERQNKSSFIQVRLGLTKDDIIYTSLPLYHSAAFYVGFSNAVRVGCTIAITNFSARRFWDDVRKYRATVIQYIGEICRYLLAQPPRADDGKYSHKIRYAIGNGLRPDIWEEFQKRFNIPRIAEFYGATEGTYMSMNLDGKVGSTGKYHGIIKDLMDSITIVCCDVDTASPLRSSDGKCILTPQGETGLLLVRLTDKKRFDGYLAGDRGSNEKKLVRNVKHTGDMFFNTGDLMLHDKDGHIYFKDRLGDTFRWKGENVATTEVANTLNRYADVQESNVYGVQVPGHDGRAGMAAIVLRKDRQLDAKNFYGHVVKSLPLYACPKFLRIMDEMHVTGTFKHKKTDLAREGFDLNVVSDPLFFMDTEMKTYTPLDTNSLRRLTAGLSKM